MRSAPTHSRIVVQASSSGILFPQAIGAILAYARSTLVRFSGSSSTTDGSSALGSAAIPFSASISSASARAEVSIGGACRALG